MINFTPKKGTISRVYNYHLCNRHVGALKTCKLYHYYLNPYILTGADETELALDSRVFRVGMVTTQHEMPTVASGNSSSSVHSLRSGL